MKSKVPRVASAGTRDAPLRSASLRCFGLLFLFLGFADPAHLEPAAGRSEDVSFRNGDVALSGTLYLPVGVRRHPAVVVLHASGGGTRDHHAYQHLATALPAAGFAALLFDRRGSGASTGDFKTARFAELAADGLAGIAHLRSRPDIDPTRIGIWGVSQGGWLGPLAASMSREVSFVVSVSGPGVSPASQMDFAASSALQAAGWPPHVVNRALRVRAAVNAYYRGKVPGSEAEQAIATIRHEPWFGQVFLPNSGILPADATRTKWYAEMDYNPLDALERVGVPMAFFFAETDPWVPVEQSIISIRQATRANPSVAVWRIPDADHLMETGKPDSGGPISAAYVKLLLEWLNQRGRNLAG